MQKIKSQFKYQSRVYNVQSNSYVNHRGIKIRWNNKIFPYGSKGILRHYNYRSYPKLGPGIFSIR